MTGLQVASEASPARMEASMESFYPDPEGMLSGICVVCGISMDFCSHRLVRAHSISSARDF